MKWIIPFNGNKHYYDLSGALYDCGVDWNRNNYTYEIGDIVYIYECEPENQIRFKCIVTDDHKNVSTFNDKKYGGVYKGTRYDKPAIETQLEYEFKQPIQLEELVKHGMRTKRKAVMKEDGLRSELFRFLEVYEAEDRKSDDHFNPEQDPATDYQMLPGEERKATVSERIHQREFRQGLLKKYPHCCLCSVENRELLNASHIKPWDKSTSEEKTNLNNGLLLCPNHDRLFDKGFISFDSNGRILVSEDLSDVDRTFMNVNPNFTLEMNDEMKEFMEYHRDNIFKK